ncbi:hypothetical protein Dimus_019885 [Dionaea muscipula]
MMKHGCLVYCLWFPIVRFSFPGVLVLNWDFKCVASGFCVVVLYFLLMRSPEKSRSYLKGGLEEGSDFNGVRAIEEEDLDGN